MVSPARDQPTETRRVILSGGRGATPSPSDDDDILFIIVMTIAAAAGGSRRDSAEVRTPGPPRRPNLGRYRKAAQPLGARVSSELPSTPVSETV